MKEQIIQELLNISIPKFVSRYVLERTPYLFNNDHFKYLDWRATLAEKISVDPCSVLIIGSAGVGISFNPHKNFKSFDQASDIDVAVISSYHFEEAWRTFRTVGATALRLPKDVKNAIYLHRNHYIYAGTIATDKVLGLFPFGQTWQIALSDMAKVDPTIDREIKIRLYRDFEALRHYQSTNIIKLRQDILESQIGDV